MKHLKKKIKLWNNKWLRSVAAVLVLVFYSSSAYSHLFITSNSSQIYNELIYDEGLVSKPIIQTNLKL
jgi:hypothetical protein